MHVVGVQVCVYLKPPQNIYLVEQLPLTIATFQIHDYRLSTVVFVCPYGTHSVYIPDICFVTQVKKVTKCASIQHGGGVPLVET